MKSIKSLTAMSASVGFFAAVNPQVNNEPLFDRKSLATNLTAKRFDTCVSGQVSFEGADLGERLIADVAFKWPLSATTCQRIN